MYWILLLTTVMAGGSGIEAGESVPYGVGNWAAERGNHRAVVHVDVEADAAWAHLPWRRRDAGPEKKAVFVVDGATGQRIANVVAVHVTRACDDIVFQPITVPGKYYVCYLPSKLVGRYFTQGAYEPVKDTTDGAWRSRVGLTGESLETGQWRKLPRAELVAFEAIDEYDKFTAIERTATSEELERLLSEHPDAAFLLFPEDRKQPIRMRDHLPKRWIEQMIGYWVPNCPVETDHESVLATVYRKPAKTLISLASWATDKADCRLAIDFSALGLDPSKVRLRAPAVPNFQPSTTFRPSQAIPVDPGRGWLLVLEEHD